MGYLSELTAHERLTVDNATIDIFAAFENGSGLIYEVWERYFSDRVQKEIESRELAFIGQILWAAYDLMSDAIRDYHLMLGHYDEPGVESFLEISETRSTDGRCRKSKGTRPGRNAIRNL